MRLRTRQGTFTLGLSLALAAATLSAPAQAQDAAAGEALFSEGKSLATEGRWAEACPKFEASYAADPTLGTILNLADCLEHEGKLASALRRFTEAKAALDAAGDARAAVAEERRAALEPRAPRAIVRSRTKAKAELEVRLDDEVIPVADVTSEAGHEHLVDPGDRKVEVRRGGDVLTTKTAHVDEAGRVEIDLDLAEIERTHPEEQPLAPIAKEPPSQTPRVAGWVLVGTGGLAVVGATLLEVVALGWQSDSEQLGHCRDALCTPTGKSEVDTAGDLAEAGQWVGIAGLGLLAVGVTLVIAAPSAESNAAARIVPPAANETPKPAAALELRAGVGRVALEGAF